MSIEIKPYNDWDDEDLIYILEDLKEEWDLFSRGTPKMGEKGFLKAYRTFKSKNFYFSNGIKKAEAILTANPSIPQKLSSLYFNKLFELFQTEIFYTEKIAREHPNKR